MNSESELVIWSSGDRKTFSPPKRCQGLRGTKIIHYGLIIGFFLGGGFKVGHYWSIFILLFFTLTSDLHQNWA